MQSENATTEDKWLTQADYARKFNCTPAAVNKAIKAGRLRTNGKTGRYLLVDSTSDLRGRTNDLSLEFKGDCDANGFARFEVTEAPEQPDFFAPAADMNEVKRRKLEAEILVLQDRLTTTRRRLFENCAEGILDAFVESFGELRSELLKLGLDAAKSQKLALTFDQCLENFTARVNGLEADL